VYSRFKRTLSDSVTPPSHGSTSSGQRRSRYLCIALARTVFALCFVCGVSACVLYSCGIPIVHTQYSADSSSANTNDRRTAEDCSHSSHRRSRYPSLMLHHWTTIDLSILVSLSLLSLSFLAFVLAQQSTPATIRHSLEESSHY
jgi:hypothetical protein